jgi:hypothetical protein
MWVCMMVKVECEEVKRRRKVEEKGVVKLWKRRKNCGWEVYINLNSRVEYLMKKKWECKKGKVCMR